MKKNSILISIIIPVYNVEEYVFDCLKSVLEQINDNVEVIIVDDGSTDDSLKICKQTVSEFNGHIYIYSQNNRGLSAARNKGVNLANGKYIMFVDSDDKLDSRAIEILVSYINNFPKVDIFYYDASIIDQEKSGRNNFYNRADKIPSDVQMTNMEYFCNYYVEALVVSACLYLVRKDVIVNNGIMFDEGRLYEDNCFSFNLIMKVHYVCYISKALYLRRYRTGSITCSRIKEKNIEDICFILDKYLEKKDEITAYGNIAAANNYLALICSTYGWGYSLMENENLNIECMHILIDKIYNAIIDWPQELRSITYYMAVNKISEYRKTDFVPYGTLTEIFKTKLLQMFEEIRELSTKPVAIYGRGVHTNIFKEEYRMLTGNELNNVIYADTFESGGINEDGIKIVNITDVAEYADTIIISSFKYRLEMLKKCQDCNLDINIYDFYKNEKMCIFDKKII